MSTAFPESYDEIAVLAHYGASDSEIRRLVREREQLSMEERHHLDIAARGHYGRTLEQIRARWREHGDKPATTVYGEDAATAEATDSVPADDKPDADDDRSAGRAGPPDGTMADVLNWVGADPERARQAIAAEENRDDPRTSLIGRLKRIANG